MTTSPPISTADRDTAKDCILYVEKHPELRTILHRFCEAYEARVVELEAANEKLRFDLRLIREQQKDDFARATALLEALTTAHVAMTLARALPGVDDEYDFAQAIDVARAAIAAQQDRQTEG